MPKRAAIIGFLAGRTALPSWAQGLDLSPKTACSNTAPMPAQPARPSTP